MTWESLLTMTAGVVGTVAAIFQILKLRNSLGFGALSRWFSRRRPALHAAGCKAVLRIDQNGGGTVRRSWDRIRSRRVVPVPCIPETIRGPDQECQFLGLPAVTIEQEFTKSIQPITRQECGCVRTVELLVVGGLGPKDPPLCYQHVTHFKSTAMVSKGHEPTTSYQAFSVDLLFPVDRLSVEVHLPGSCELEAFPIAFFYGSEHPDVEQLPALRRSFSRNGNVARLELEKPLVGPRYGIYWVPAHNGSSCVWNEGKQDLE